MEKDCPKAIQNLVSLKKLKAEYALLYAESMANRDFSPLKTRKDELKALIEDAKKALDFYGLKLRHQLTKKLKAKLVEPFTENKAKVIDQDLTVYFINRVGDRITSQKYRDVLPYSEGRAAVQLAREVWSMPEWSFIDEKGRQLKAKTYNEVKPFSGGFAAVRDEEGWFYIDRSGKPAIFPHQNKDMRFLKAESFTGIIAAVGIRTDSENTYENFIIKNSGEILPTGKLGLVHDFNSRFIEAYRSEDKEGKNLLIDKTTAVFRKVVHANALSQGGAENSKNILILDDDDNTLICDENGNLLTKNKFDTYGWFSEGLMAVKLDGEWILTDVNGRSVNISEHDGWSSCSVDIKTKKIFAVAVENGRIVEKYSGNEEVIGDFDENTNLVTCHEDKKMVIMNFRGERLFESECHHLYVLNENRFVIQKEEDGDKYIVDKAGTEILKGNEIRRIGTLIKVIRDELWYLHDFDGNMIGDPEGYNSILLSEENIIVEKQKKYYLLDKNLQMVGDKEGYDGLRKYGEGVFRCEKVDTEGSTTDIFFIDYMGRRFGA